MCAMPGVFTMAKRAAVMARIRSRGNRDTELALVRLLRQAGIRGWRRQVEIRVRRSPRPALRVRPDFVFPRQRVAVFVDGCFWHGCPAHAPPERWLRKSSMPVTTPQGPRKGPAQRTGKEFWRRKLRANRARDRLVTKWLRWAGWRVIRIGEHELQSPGAAQGRAQSGRVRRRAAWPRSIGRIRMALGA